MAERLRYARALAAAIGRGLAAPLSVLLIASLAVLVAPARDSGSADASTYSFTSHTFTPCGATGQSGPTLTNCRSAYSTSWANSTANFDVIGGIQHWTVPVTGLYEITAAGARGGGTQAGNGRVVSGRLLLTGGHVLKILVGQQGVVGTQNAAGSTGGGGGGSFVATSANVALVVGGGGGGSGDSAAASHGQTSTCGATGTNSGGAGGCAGSGGAAVRFAGGGAGFSSNGTTKTHSSEGSIPASFSNGGTGGGGGLQTTAAGGHGGFGGGAGSCACSTGGGGGGGGYGGGGGGGPVDWGAYGGGGGGGSYVTGSATSVNTNVGLNASTGYVTIQIVAPVVSEMTPSVTSPTNVSSFSYSITFSEPVTGFDSSDISLSGSSAGWSIVSLTGSGAGPYSLALSSTGPTTGSLTVTIATNSVSGGTSGMQGPPAAHTATMAIDVDPPAASVASAPSSPASAVSLTFGLSFTESVSGISSVDFSNGGTALGCVFTPSVASGSSVNVVVTQCQEGTLQLVMASNSVSDAAGNTGPTTTVSSSVVTLSASGLTVTAATQSVNYGGSWTDSYSQSGLIGGDSITVSYSYSGTTNDGASYGPSSTKPTEGGSYLIIPAVAYGAGNANRYALTRNNGALTIARIAQSPITVSSTSATYGQTLSLTTTGGSGTGAVSWQVVSGTCSIDGSSLTPGNAGSACVVRATKAQDGNYLVRSSVDTAVTIARAAQATLTVSSTSATYGEILQLTTSGGSGNGAVSWQVVSGTCSVVGNDLTPGNAGSACVVRATKAQDTNYLVRSSADTTIAIGKANQTGFTITSNTAFTTGASLSLTASGGQSGGAVTWSLNSGACTLAGSTLTASRGGITCVVEATRAGSTNYFAVSETETITVNKIIQVLTFRSTPPASPIVGGTYTVSVDSDASLAVTVAVANTSSSVCSISAGVVSFTGVGSCVISASQSGNDVYAAAAASQSIAVTAAPVPTTVPPPVDPSAASPSQTTSPPTTTPLPPVTTTVPRRTTPSTTTTTTTTTTTVPSFGSGEVGLEAGETTAMVKGRKVKVDISNDDGNLVVKLPNNVMVKVGPPKGSSSSARVNADGVLAGYERDEVEVSAEGFLPGSTFVVMMYSTPVELSRGVVSSEGRAGDIVQIPEDAESGDHTLVIEGVGEGDEVVAVSLGFTVLERSDNTWAAITAITVAMLLALLGGRPVWRRRRVRASAS